jgi:DNA-directed RNA polymerase specialized sigma subunit
LSDRERYIVGQIYWHGATQTDVAQRLGLSKMAVSKAVARIHDRGRLALAELL